MNYRKWCPKGCGRKVYWMYRSRNTGKPRYQCVNCGSKYKNKDEYKKAMKKEGYKV